MDQPIFSTTITKGEAITQYDIYRVNTIDKLQHHITRHPTVKPRPVICITPESFQNCNFYGIYKNSIPYMLLNDGQYPIRSRGTTSPSWMCPDEITECQAININHQILRVASPALIEMATRWLASGTAPAQVVEHIRSHHRRPHEKDPQAPHPRRNPTPTTP